MNSAMNKDLCFTIFNPQPARCERPEKFTFPFHYVPHPWSVRASEELIQKIESVEFGHDFGLHTDTSDFACGKMFGVLVVENPAGEIGYLAAFSGKLGDSNNHLGFVPPLFDMLEPDGHFKTSEARLTAMNKLIEELETATELNILKEEIDTIARMAEEARLETKNALNEGKRARAAIRANLHELNPQDAAERNASLNKQSHDQQSAYKHETRLWRSRLDEKKQILNQLITPIEVLKSERKQRSAALQNWLFEQYRFANSKNESKSLAAIFTPNEPPAGAGECAAPKLLQYAFMNGYKPLCLAEFWWGKSPATEIRLHRNYYPACRGKCLPILGFMLEGIELDANPLLDSAFDTLQFEILAEDDALLVINKPSGLLSVPGKTRQDSVYHQVKRLRPDITGPIIVHRLDRSTSGIMLIPKTAHAYHYLQQQFIGRSIEKRYVALIEGEISENEGVINLPIRPDIDDRPRQLVCFEHGREAITHWQKVSTRDGRTRIHFFPKTGRTHQLRVHAAHKLGLNAGICGDELYGKGGERLKLHAASIAFKHPTTEQQITITQEPDF
jgi:tRNA pseudouridine32 synthase/23S rRNA pseudouridine746 synthase